LTGNLKAPIVHDGRLKASRKTFNWRGSASARYGGGDEEKSIISPYLCGIQYYGIATSLVLKTGYLLMIIENKNKSKKF
jgi:hypothetical protein